MLNLSAHENRRKELEFHDERHNNHSYHIVSDPEREETTSSSSIWERYSGIGITQNEELKTPFNNSSYQSSLPDYSKNEEDFQLNQDDLDFIESLK